MYVRKQLRRYSYCIQLDFFKNMCENVHRVSLKTHFIICFKLIEARIFNLGGTILVIDS